MRDENCPIARINTELVSEESLYSAWVTQRIREKVDYETNWLVVLKSLVDDNAERK